ncbi:MAG: hypothetical protein KJO07_15175 [Deltaproteobacteria bacterium]|nr:hypothetical protein [Deltaproteobacteria bacterium]
MTDEVPPYSGFLGTWVLDPRSCQYQQGEPPQAGSYRISEVGDELRFQMQWVDADGEKHQVEFSGAPDGVRYPFKGGELADALAVTAVSERELSTSAFYQGREVMTAQRQLDDTGRAMRITQIVRFLDGTRLANVAIYIKRESN